MVALCPITRKKYNQSVQYLEKSTGSLKVQMVKKY